MSGALLSLSGTLILAHSYCSTFAPSGGSGGDICTVWDTTIPIPAVEFFVRAIGFALFEVAGLFLVFIIAAGTLYAVCKFFYNILSHR